MNNKVKLGLKYNWKAFSILVFVNALVGGLLGLERSIMPSFADDKFHLNGYTFLLAFIVSFGFFKAIFNFFAGKWIGHFGRKRILLLGWVLAIPIPFLLIYAPSWEWIVVANVFLGMNQGLAWSTAVIMKMDLVGKHERGFAMGINEFAGYVAIGGGAFVSHWLYTHPTLEINPFFLSICIVALGFVVTLFFVNDTCTFVEEEAFDSKLKLVNNVFQSTSFRDPALRRITQAGLVNNLNDGLLWGVLPVWVSLQGFQGKYAALLIAIYPITWGVFQLFTGKLADRFSKNNLIFFGMTLQAMALLLYSFKGSFNYYLCSGMTMGFGTALVYPTFLASIAERLHPKQRAEGLGAFRFWRDMGYVFGALICGVLLDAFNFPVVFAIIALTTFLSGVYAKI